jgi:hypothetical protein
MNTAQYMWRAELPDKVTQAGWKLTVDGVTADFSGEGKDNLGDTVTTPDAVADRESGSVLLNINASQFLQLSNPGDIYRLYALRTWEIIASEIGNKVIAPDFNYRVLTGDDVVSLVPDDDLWFNYRSTITALKTGTAIVEVTYDALDAAQAGTPGLPTGRYGATNPQRKGLAVITVGEIAQGDVEVRLPWTETGTFAAWDSEFDTWYFAGESEQITIHPTAADVVSVQSWNPDAQDDWVDVIDGALTLYPGNNIVKVTNGDGLSYYKVIRGNTVEIQAVSDIGDRPLKAGDQVRVLWGGSIPAYPVAKISGVYNPGVYNLYNTWDNTFTVTQKMIDDGVLYDASVWKNVNPKTPVGDGYYRLGSTVGGGHRGSTLTGAANTSPNAGKSAASTHAAPFSVIPPVRLTDYLPAEPTDVTISMQLDDTGLQIAKQEFTVEPDLSETYGLPDAYNGGGVTALDAFVAAHIAIFGDEDLSDYIIDAGGYYVYAFAELGLIYFVNGKQPGDGVYVYDSSLGVNSQMGYTFAEALLSGGDDVLLYAIQDGDTYMDYIAWFEQDGAKQAAITVEAEEDINLNLVGLMNWYAQCDADAQAAFAEEVYDAAIQFVTVEETPGLCVGLFEDTGIITDDDGAFTLRFDEPGTYIISAVAGNFDFPLVSPWLEVTVTESLAAAKAEKIAAVNAVDDDLIEEDYTPESWTALQDAIAKAIADITAAESIADVDAINLPTADGLVGKTIKEPTYLEQWETKLPDWLSWISPLPDWLEWILMVTGFGWIWWLF